MVATVGELHARDPFADGPVAEPQVWLCEPTDAAIVLGSRQSPDLLDRTACERAGLAIVRRRSGGGAVLVRAREMVWVDLVLPHGVAPDDIRGAMRWAGDRWVEALARPGLTVHAGGMVCTPWSDLVCFAGTGPGEVIVGGRKLVGLSQRRTRHGIRIQGMAHRIEPDVASLFGVEVPGTPLVPPAIDPSLDAETIGRRLVAAIDGDAGASHP